MKNNMQSKSEDKLNVGDSLMSIGAICIVVPILFAASSSNNCALLFYMGTPTFLTIGAGLVMLPVGGAIKLYTDCKERWNENQSSKEHLQIENISPPPTTFKTHSTKYINQPNTTTNPSQIPHSRSKQHRSVSY